MVLGAAEADFECAGQGDVVLRLENAAAGEGHVVGEFEAEDHPIVQMRFDAQSHGHAQQNAGIVRAQAIGEFDPVGAQTEQQVRAERRIAPGIIEKVDVPNEMIGVARARWRRGAAFAVMFRCAVMAESLS